MNEAMDLCRLCTNVADQTNSEKLFERHQRKLLQQIEEIMGEPLKKSKNLPQHICKTCEDQTLQAHKFRAQCIRAQQHFVISDKRTPKSSKKAKAKLPIEVVNINELDAHEDDRTTEEISDASATLAHIKHETSMHLENKDFNAANSLDDDYEDSFKPLDGCQTTTDQEELMMNTEPAISFTAEEQSSMPNQKESPPYKKRYCRRKNIFICELCGKQLQDASGFRRHKLVHSGIRQFQCEKCPKNFPAKQELIIHTRNHTGEKPYACSYCDSRFKDCTSKVIHERYHTNVRPFPCELCEKAFTKSSHLKRHLVDHTGERPYECSLCNVTFPFTKNLNQHFTTLKHKQNVEKQKSTEAD